MLSILICKFCPSFRPKAEFLPWPEQRARFNTSWGFFPSSNIKKQNNHPLFCQLWQHKTQPSPPCLKTHDLLFKGKMKAPGIDNNSETLADFWIFMTILMQMVFQIELYLQRCCWKCICLWNCFLCLLERLPLLIYNSLRFPRCLLGAGVFPHKPGLWSSLLNRLGRPRLI